MDRPPLANQATGIGPHAVATLMPEAHMSNNVKSLVFSHEGADAASPIHSRYTLLLVHRRNPTSHMDE